MSQIHRSVQFGAGLFVLACLSLVRLNAATTDDPTVRGDTALDAGDYAAAVAAYTEAIARDPKNARIYMARAGAYDQLGDMDKALADANEAIKLDPKNAEAWVARGWAK